MLPPQQAFSVLEMRMRAIVEVQVVGADAINARALFGASHRRR
jgi:hypothetical protein